MITVLCSQIKKRTILQVVLIIAILLVVLNFKILNEEFYFISIEETEEINSSSISGFIIILPFDNYFIYGNLAIGSKRFYFEKAIYIDDRMSVFIIRVKDNKKNLGHATFNGNLLLNNWNSLKIHYYTTNRYGKTIIKTQEYMYNGNSENH